MTNKDWIGAVEQARMGINNDVQSRLQTLENQGQQLLTNDIATQDVSELSSDQANTNLDFSVRCDFRVEAASASIIQLSGITGTKVGIWNGGLWSLLDYRVFEISGSPYFLLRNTLFGDTANGSAVMQNITVNSLTPPLGCVAQLVVGMEVLGTGIPADTYILSVDSPTQITLTQNCTSTTVGNTVTTYMPPCTDFDLYAIDTGGAVLGLRAVLYNARSNGVITGATNATPIVITSTSHGLATNDIVVIRNVLGNTAANGQYRITVLTANTFSLQTLAAVNIAGSGAYTSGGRWVKVNQSPVSANNPNVLDAEGVWTLNNGTWRYIATIHSSTNIGEIEDSNAVRGIWNFYNRIAKKLLVADSTASWTVSTGAGWQADRNNYANRVQFIIGYPGTAGLSSVVSIRKHSSIRGQGGAAGNGFSGVSLDAVQSPTYFTGIRNITSTVAGGAHDIGYSDYPDRGYHYAQGMEEATVQPITVFGNGEHLIEGEVWC